MPEGFRLCPDCGGQVFYPAHGLDRDYHPLTHGPLRPKPVSLDIDGPRTAEGFDRNGMRLSGELLKEGDDPEARGGRVFLVYQAHDCEEEAEPARAAEPEEEPAKWGIERGCPD